MRVPERGNMVGGVQYDSIPNGEPMTASGSMTSFSLAQVEAGRTHPMLPPDEGRTSSARAGAAGADGTATSASAALGKNDLTNLKLASNQQVSVRVAGIRGVELTALFRSCCWKSSG